MELPPMVADTAQPQNDLHTTMITSIAVSPTNPDLLAALLCTRYLPQMTLVLDHSPEEHL